MTVMSALQKGISALESVPSTALHIIIVVTCVGILRFLLESLVTPSEDVAIFYSVLPFIHGVAFYAGVFFLFLLALDYVLPTEPHKARSVVLAGIAAGVLPPIIDAFLPTPNLDYVYFFEFTWNFVSAAQPLGESVVLWLVVFSIGLYSWYRTRKVVYAMYGFAFGYVTMQVGSWIIPELAMALFNALLPLIGGVTAGALKSLILAKTVFALMWTVVAFFAFMFYRKALFFPIVQRFPHAVIWGALLLFGAQLGPGIDAYAFVKAGVFVLAFMLIQAENDYYDKELDRLTARESGITHDDLLIVRFLRGLLVASFVALDPLFSVLLVSAFLLGFLYHHPAFRLKRHFVSGTILEGMCAFVVLLAGLSSFSSLASNGMLWVVLLGASIFGVCANMRDYKDYQGDSRGGITTMHVLLQRYGIAPRTTHLIFLCTLACFTALSVVGYFNLGVITKIGTLFVAVVLLSLPLPFYFLVQPKKSTTAGVVHATLVILFFALFIVPAFV